MPVNPQAKPAVLVSDPVIEAYKQHIDRTLLRESLKLTVGDRLLKLMKLQQFARELRQAGRRAFS